MRFVDPSRPDTPAQKLVRTFGMVAFLAGMAAGPLAALLLPPNRTQASTQRPAFGWKAFRRGTWMKQLEVWLKEDSPVNYQLRGRWHELRYATGILHIPSVHIGKDEWFFLRDTLDASEQLLRERAPARSTSLRSLARRLDSLGVAILAIPAPDKTRLYPELAYADGVMPPARASLYGLILQDLADAGIPALDAATVMQGAKAESKELLFYPRDTHWSAHGAAVVAQAVRPRLRDLGLLDRLGPPVDLELTPVQRVRLVHDLLGLLGMRSDVPPGTTAPSALVDRLMEEHDIVSMRFPGQPERSPEDGMEAAQVALCGTSYSGQNFRWMLACGLGCLVDFRGVVAGKGPFHGLRETIGRIERGESKARLIVWEFVERMYLEEQWLTPPQQW